MSTELTKQHIPTIILVPVCDVFAHRYWRTRKTWGRLAYEGVKIFYVFGNAKEAHIQDDIILLPVQDEFEDLHKKTYAQLQLLYKHFTFDVVWKVDDDCYARVDKFLTVPNDIDYCGYQQLLRKTDDTLRVYHASHPTVVDTSNFQGSFPPFWASGFCYRLSYAFVEYVCSLEENELPELSLDVGYEDVMIGNVFHKAMGRFTFLDIRSVPCRRSVLHTKSSAKIHLAHLLNRIIRRFLPKRIRLMF